MPESILFSHHPSSISRQFSHNSLCIEKTQRPGGLSACRFETFGGDTCESRPTFICEPTRANAAALSPRSILLSDAAYTAGDAATNASVLTVLLRLVVWYFRCAKVPRLGMVQSHLLIRPARIAPKLGYRIYGLHDKAKAVAYPHHCVMGRTSHWSILPISCSHFYFSQLFNSSGLVHAAQKICKMRLAPPSHCDPCFPSPRIHQKNCPCSCQVLEPVLTWSSLQD